jgi:hypothetical protein
MQTAAGSDTPEIENPDHRSVLSELLALAERIEASMKLLEQAISSETTCSDPEIRDSVFVLDDVTPCYARAGAALLACQIGLGEALHLIRDIPTSAPDPGRLARSRGRLAGCR